jgi:hypothetical protein
MRKLVALLVALVATTAANAAVITFDSLPGALEPVPDGYSGLSWTNVFALNGITYSGNPSGYQAGVVSSPIVAFNSAGVPAEFSSETTFNFVSAYLTSAWRDGLQVLVEGFDGATLLYSSTVFPSATSPTNFLFNFNGVNRVRFTPSGGTIHPGYSGTGTNFAMDNVSINTNTEIPEPLSLVVFGGLIVGGAGVALRRRMSKTTA